MDRKKKKDISKKRITKRLTQIEPNEDRNKGRVTRSLAKMELKRSRASKEIMKRNKRMKAPVACSTRPNIEQIPFSTVEPNDDRNKGRVTRSLAKMELKRSRASKEIIKRNKRMKEDDTEDSTEPEAPVACSTRPNIEQIPFSTVDDQVLLGASTSKKRKRKMPTKKTKIHLQMLRSILSGVRIWKEIVDEENEYIPGVEEKKEKKKKKMPKIEPTGKPDNRNLFKASTSKETEKEMSTVEFIDQPEKGRDIPNGLLLESDNDTMSTISSMSTSPLLDYTYTLLKDLKRNRKQRRKLQRAFLGLEDSDNTEESLSDFSDLYSQKSYLSKGSFEYHENEEGSSDTSDSSIQEPMIKPFSNGSYLCDIESVVSEDSDALNVGWINRVQKKFPYLSFDCTRKLPNNFSMRIEKTKDVMLIAEKDRIATAALFNLLLNVDLSDVDLRGVEESNSANITLKNVPRIPRFELPCTEEYASWSSQKKKNAEKQVSEFNARIALIELFKDIFIKFESTQSNSNNEFNSENQKITSLYQPEIAEELSQPKNSDESKLSESNNGPQSQNSDEAVAGSSSAVEEQNLNKCEVGCNVWSDIHSEFWKDFNSEFWSGIHSEINLENQNGKTSSKQEIDKAFSQLKTFNESELFESNKNLLNYLRVSKPEIAEKFSEPKTSEGDVAGSSSAVEEKNLKKCKYGCTVFNKEPCFHKRCINYLYEKFPIPEIAEAFLQSQMSDESDFNDSKNELNSMNRNKEILSKSEIVDAFSKPKNSDESELSESDKRLNSANSIRITFSKPEIAKKSSQFKNRDEADAGCSSVVEENYQNKCKWGCTVLKEVPCFHEKCIKYLTSSKQEIAGSISQANVSNESESSESNNRLSSVNQNCETLTKPQINEAILQPKNSDENVAGSSKTKQNKEIKCKFGCTVLNEEPCYHDKWIKYVKENETKLRKEVEERINKLKIESKKNYEKEVVDRFIKSIANVKFTKK